MTTPQRKLASILPHIGGTLSMIGNAAIIMDIVRRFRNNRRDPNNPNLCNTIKSQRATYHRLMLGLSVTNVSASMTCLSSWPMPVGTAWNTFGNDATCVAQAFFLQFGIAAILYHMALAVYYFQFIVKNAPTSRILMVERFMHPFCVLVGLGTSIAGVAMDIFGPASFWCWIEQGENGENEIYRWLFWHGPLWATIIIDSVIMALIYHKLRRQEKIQNTWAWARSTAAGSFLVPRMSSLLFRKKSNDNVEAVDANNQHQSHQEQQSAVVASENYYHPRRASAVTRRSSISRRSFNAAESFKWQSLWYLATFYLTWIFLTIVRGIQAAKKPVPFWLVLLTLTFTPLLGFFNALVYFRPKYRQRRMEHPETGRLATLWIVAFPSCTRRRSGSCVEDDGACCCGKRNWRFRFPHIMKKKDTMPMNEDAVEEEAAAPGVEKEPNSDNNAEVEMGLGDLGSV